MCKEKTNRAIKLDKTKYLTNWTLKIVHNDVLTP